MMTETKMNNNRMTGFGADTTTDEVLADIDLNGKTILITGGSSGLGKESARALASHGAKVIITARNLEKAATVVEKIQQENGATVDIEELELSAFSSIRAFAKRILERAESIDVLILNAGVMACPYSKTEDGFEMQFGTNHLGHFLLTNLILPKLSEGGRIISLSSAGHQFSPVIFGDIQFENRNYDRWLAYGQAKTANALFALGLNKRFDAQGIEAFSVHPGAIQTDLQRHLTEEDFAMFQSRVESGTMPLKTIPSGAATQVLAATAPELAGKGGAYLADCQICEVNNESNSWNVVRSYAVDPVAAERLWQISETMIGESINTAVFR